MGVRLHQGSSLSPYLFAMIMDVLAHGIKDLSLWCMLYADDIVLCGTRREVVEKKLQEWRRAIDRRAARRGQGGRLTTLNFRTGAVRPP